MKRLEEFRIYYNHTIHPELVRLERKRMRLLSLIAISVIALIALIILEFYISILAITLTLMIPIAFFIAYLVYRVRNFILTFKPHVMELILDFIDDGLNFGTLTYEANRSIPKSDFLLSHLFHTPANQYFGEDFISGKVGEMTFEMCELTVQETTPVTTGLIPVFRGVFTKAVFSETLEGVVVVWPRKYRQRMVSSIKYATSLGAENVDSEILNEKFRELFITYAMPDTHVVGMLPETMQEAIIQYIEEFEERERKRAEEFDLPEESIQQRDVFLSIINSNVYVAFSEQKDLLEPNLWSSNLSFELVREFFDDIHFLLRIVEAFDQTH